jgi:tRNA-uridine 2-sulfurtransferase
MKEKVVVGMSGGVDSSMTLLLLKKQGYDPIGVSLKFSTWQSDKNTCKENVCCTDKSFQTAKDVCDKLNVPYYIYEVKDAFDKNVINYFVDELKLGRTPNPCIMCNRNFKFDKLFEFASKHGIEKVSTGHYARISFNKLNEVELKLAKDETKDQTYGLCMLPQHWLKNIILPLGDYLKKEVYDLAEIENFNIFLKQKQSQDLCFVSKKSMPAFIEHSVGIKKGNIVDDEGNILGQHNGTHFFTLGQKRGLNLSSRYYVKKLDKKNNLVVVTNNQKDMIKVKKILINPYNLISKHKFESKEIIAKIRYGDSLPSKAKIFFENEKMYVEFNEPRENVTNGQFCVFYENDMCLGGGIINSLN